MRARRPPTRTPNDGTLGSICPSRRHRSILHTFFLLIDPRMDREITDAARAEDRERELAAIAAHLAARGVTRCPPAFAGISCVRQVQQIDHVERALVDFQVNSSIPLFDRK